MSIGIQAKANVISTVVQLVEGGVFHRIVEEMKRVQEANPEPLVNEDWDTYSARKRHIVIEDCKIIFDDLLEPVGEGLIRLLIQVGMIYLKTAVL